MTRSRFTELAVLVVLLGAVAYEAVVALEWTPVGTEPGENARYDGLVMALASLALLAGVVISLVLAARDRRSVLAAMLPGAATALMVAVYYTFDTYYLPTLPDTRSRARSLRLGSTARVFDEPIRGLS